MHQIIAQRCYQVRLQAAPDGKSNERKAWDFGRFVSTLLFFNPPPSLQSIVEGMLSKESTPRRSSSLEKNNTLTRKLDILLGDGSSSFASKHPWGPLDDVVMGGVSISSIESVEGEGEGGRAAMVFRGLVSVDNSGGFASVRSKNFEPPLDLANFNGIELRVKGDGQRYKMILRTVSGWDAVCYCHSFDTKKGWQTIRIPFSTFFPVFRAKKLKDGTMDLSTLYSIQLMLSKFEYDGDLNPNFSPGGFSLPIAKIAAY